MKIKIGDRVKKTYGTSSFCGIVTNIFGSHLEIKRDDGMRGGGRNGDWIIICEDIEILPRNIYCGDRNKKEV